MERNNQVTYWCVQIYVFWWLGFAYDKSTFMQCNMVKVIWTFCRMKLEFTAVLLLSGYCKIPYQNLYWADATDKHNEAVPCAMNRIHFERYYLYCQTLVWLTTCRLQKIDTTRYEYYLKNWISISNGMVHLSITPLMKAFFLTIENMAQNNLLERSPLGLGLKFCALSHLKDISFMQNHIVE